MILQIDKKKKQSYNHKDMKKKEGFLMKKKIANGIELILLIITFVVLNIATIQVGNLDVPTATLGHMKPLTLINHYILQAFPMYFLYVTIAIMCVVSIITKNEHRDGKMHSILPILWFLIVNWNIICLQGEIGSWLIVSSEKFPATLFEVCAIAVVVLGFVKRSTLIAGLPKEKVVVNQVSQADELGKYKDLLDKGVITQEEFDAKKKQLLGL